MDCSYSTENENDHSSVGGGLQHRRGLYDYLETQLDEMSYDIVDERNIVVFCPDGDKILINIPRDTK
jgi:hypothetical protein